MESKSCTQCGINKPLSEFSYRKQRRKHNSHCKACSSMKNMVRDYGISPQTYNVLLKDQGFLCGICGKHQDDVNSRGNIHRKLCVDHDHKTKMVRGLLCHNCNVLLGHANDDMALLMSAINYLRIYQIKR